MGTRRGMVARRGARSSADAARCAARASGAHTGEGERRGVGARGDHMRVAVGK